MTAGPVFEWESRINLFTDGFTLRDMLKVGALSLAMMWAIVAVMGLIAEGELIVIPVQTLLVIVPILLVLYVFAVLLLGVSMRMRFFVGEDGVGWAMSKRTGSLSRLAVLAGLLGGSPSTAGAGMLAVARESGMIPWADIVSVIAYPDRRVIALRDGWHTRLRLYCTAGEYDAILAYAREHAASPAAATSVPLPRLSRRALGIVAIAVVAAVGVASWDWAFYSVSEQSMLVLAVLAIAFSALSSMALRRITGLVGFVSAAYVGLRIIIEAVDPITTPSGMALGYGWELDTPLLVLSVAGVCVLLALSGHLVLGRRRQG
ncbi:MAG: hypothetical protein JXE06_06790 [Coriobacteriia bacterium]|nr:hypothetical protein [Coriobacteriia bacterium]MBN2823585.1 hypothetical protein [Coriobacteriia bacterium]